MKETQEKPIKSIMPSRNGFFLQYIVAIVAAATGLYMPGWPAVALFSVAVFMLALSEFKRAYRRLVLTNKKSILEEGIFKKHSTAIRHAAVTEIVIRQSPLQRLLSCGAITIKASGGPKEHKLAIEKIRNPQKAKKIIEHFMHSEHKI